LELSLPGAKVLWNFRSWQRKFHRTFAPGSKSSIEQHRTKVPRPNFLNVNYTVRYDIWNITCGDEVFEDPKVGQHCLMNMNSSSKGTVYSVQDIHYIQVIYHIKSNERERTQNTSRPINSMTNVE